MLALGERSEAQELFFALLRQAPDDPKMYVNATQILLEDQKWQASLNVLNEGLKRLPGNWLLLFRRAITYKLSGQFDAARTDLLEAIHNGGDIPLLSAALGDVLAAQHDFVGAAGVFQKALHDSGAPEFQLAYALAIARQGKQNEALVEMKRAVELLPRNARAHLEYGKLLQSNAQFDEARSELEYAKQLDPNLLSNLYVLSRLYRTLGESDLASKTLQEFLAGRQRHAPTR
jgi:tetratricopeptide (TPR) repeat protein